MDILDYKKKWDDRFPNNDDFEIGAVDLREFKDDTAEIIDPAGQKKGSPPVSALELRPGYFLISPALEALGLAALRWLHLDGTSTPVDPASVFAGGVFQPVNPPADGSTLAYLDASQKSVPVATNQPGPTIAVALADTVAMLNAVLPVLPGRLYDLTGDWNAAGVDSTVYVLGLTLSRWASTGWVLDANGNAQAVRVDVDAQTWEVVGKEVWVFIGDASRFNVSLGPQYGCTYDSDQFANTYFTFHGQNSYGQTHGRNTYGVFHSGNAYGRNHQNNAYGASHRNNAYGEGHYQNQLAAYHAYNTYGNDHTNNHYGPNHNGNVYGNNHQNNTFGGNQNSNTYGDNCSELEVGPGCYGLQVGAGCQRVRIYNCHGGQSAFVIPAGTVDAEYRNNQLVKSKSLSGYDYQPLYPSGAVPLQKSLTASSFNQVKRFDTYVDSIVYLPPVTAADVGLPMVIEHVCASGLHTLTVRSAGPFGLQDVVLQGGERCEQVVTTFGSQTVYAVRSLSAKQQPVAGVFRGAYASSQRYLKNDLVVEPGGTLVYAKAEITGSPTTYDATQWTPAPGGGSGGSGGSSGVTAADLAVVATTLPLTSPRTANYTLQAGDAGGVVPVAAAATVTFPDNASVPLPVGSTGYLRRTGTDPVNVAPASGVQLLPPGVGLNLDTYGELSWHKVDLNTYWLKGDLF